MYQAYFGLSDNPFSITPDPSYLYLSAHHQEALAHLLFGTRENGGFVQLTGEVGTGKTTLIRSLLAQQLERVDVALCLNPKLTEHEFVAAICDELGVEYPTTSNSLKPLIDALNAHLLQTHAAGRRTVLIIDEAQNLSLDVLEQVRLLTNLETDRDKLLRIILVGQPELLRLLAKPGLRQLAQRITARYHLPPLQRSETFAYVAHRLNVAGRPNSMFKTRALASVYRWSRGLPRLINVICDRAMLGAYAGGQQRISASLVNAAAREVLGSKAARTPSWFTAIGTTATALALAFGLQPASLHTGEALALFQPTPSDTATPGIFDYVAPAAATTTRTPPSASATAETSVATTPTEPAYYNQPLAAANPHYQEPDVAQLLNIVDTSDAIAKLLSLWSVRAALPAGADACKALDPERFRCLAGTASWADLRAFNRPAVLRLTAADGNQREVLLRSLAAQDAFIDLAGRELRVTVDSLESIWSGEFVLLWRPPVAPSVIGPGSKGAAVAWLRRQLALALSDEPPEAPSLEYDANLREQVRRFQRSRDLTADGLVGSRTMLLLNNVSPASDTPMLAAPPAGTAPSARAAPPARAAPSAGTAPSAGNEQPVG